MFPSLFINKDVFPCEICQLAKHQHSSYPSQTYQPSTPFTMIHSDIWGPSQIQSLMGKKKWFITFIDDHTRVTWVYLSKEKSEVERNFKNFHLMVQRRYNTRIKILRTDNGTEYLNTLLRGYLLERGIIHQRSCVGNPQQNGIAERKNRSNLSCLLLMYQNICGGTQSLLLATLLISCQPMF